MSEINVLQEAVEALSAAVEGESNQRWNPEHRAEAQQLALRWLECKSFAIMHHLIDQLEVEWIETRLISWDMMHGSSEANRIIVREAIGYLADTNRHRTNLGLRQHLAKLATPAVQ